MKTRFELTHILFQQQRLHQTETHHNNRMLNLIYVYKDPIERLVDVPIKDTYMIQHNNEYQPPTQNKNSSY